MYRRSVEMSRRSDAKYNVWLFDAHVSHHYYECAVVDVLDAPIPRASLKEYLGRERAIIKNITKLEEGWGG